MKKMRPLRTEADYDRALAAIAPYFLAEPALGSPAARFDDLASLIAAYEAVHWAIAPEGETGGA
jgi:HTH-type transcriptional regulator/antitoxin HigA